jgi:plasmid stabilization system protein ParE
VGEGSRRDPGVRRLTLSVVVKKAARADIADARQWYHERDPGAALDFLRALRVALSRIQRNPLQFPIEDSDVRKAPISRFPYSVYFVAGESTVTILAVMHSRRDPQIWMQRR